MNIEEIVNEYTREIIKSIFSKLDDEEKYVILELNNQLQDKINKIDKAIEYINSNDFVYDELYKKREKINDILEDKNE